MKLSQKSEYALRAMLELARQFSPEHPVRSADIARNQQIPEKFLELILVELRRAGLVSSQRGPVGGHRLARMPQGIYIGEIWRAIDGAPFERAGLGAGDPFAYVWHQVESAVSEIVDHVTLEDVRLRAETRQSVPDFNI
jgi:Rrf2 family protein